MLSDLGISWKVPLRDEFTKPYWLELEEFLSQQRADHPGNIYPPADQVFAALNLVPPESARVVLLGQDPYHGPNQAHGLSFSVPPGEKHPPSLRNIFKELQSDLGCVIPKPGTLTHWGQQGVLLLNTVLTVRHKAANSHRRQGWEQFTDAVVRFLAEFDQPLVFILWGSSAQKKAAVVDRHRHAVIKSVHPSPLSAHHGFFGSRPFSQANAALRRFGHPEIVWQIPDTVTQ